MSVCELLDRKLKKRKAKQVVQSARPHIRQTTMKNYLSIVLLAIFAATPCHALINLRVGLDPGTFEATPNIDNVATVKRYHIKNIESAEPLQVSAWVYATIQCNGNPIDPVCDPLPTTVKMRYDLVDSASNVLRTVSGNFNVTWNLFVADDFFEIHRAKINAMNLPLAGLNLPSVEYKVVGTVDPDNTIPETDNNDNDLISDDSFRYRIYSGDLFYGPIKTSLSSLAATGLCIGLPGFPHIPVGSAAAKWTHEWGESTFNPTPGCYFDSLNGDGYSYDLTTPAGLAAVNIGVLSGLTPSGLDAEIRTVKLDGIGASFSGAGVFLPEDVSAHQLKNPANPKDGFFPCGDEKIDFFSESGSFVHIYDIAVFMFSQVRELHGYGLPFNLVVPRMRFKLNDPAGLILEDVVAMHVHFPSYAGLHPRDPRGQSLEAKGFPSNDVVFMGFESGVVNTAFVDGNGVTAQDLSFQESGAVLKKARTSFPMGVIVWDQPFQVDVNKNELVPQDLPVTSFRMRARQTCPDDNCGDFMSPETYEVATADGTAWLSDDGSLGKRFEQLGKNTEWGKWEAGSPTYFRDDSSQHGVFYMPGFYMRGTKDENIRTVSRVLLGSRQFDGPGGIPGTFTPLLEGGGSSDADLGNGFYAGLTMGPEKLESLSEGAGQQLVDKQSIRFNGNPGHNQFDITAHTKYVLRPSGVTGVFNTSFQGVLNIYGYDIDFRRFAFRQVYNRLDGKTFLDGSLDIPYPCDIHVSFLDLDMTCSGDLGSGTVDSEPETDWKVPDGVDNDSDGFTDEGNDVLSYWETPISLTGMAFVPTANSGNACLDNTKKELELATLNDVNGIENFLTMRSIYPVNGKLKNQTMTGAPDNMFDKPQSSSKEGFGVRVQKAYLNQLATYPGQHVGFLNLGGLTDVPLFNDLETLLHLDNPTPSGLSLPDDSFEIYVFRDESSTDTNHNGIPDAYGSNVDNYRNMLANGNDAPEAGDPRPRAKYSWPASGLLSLNYALTYNRSDGTEMPQFLGIKKTYDLISEANPVITINSVPDYLNPIRTKFSFGVSADFAAITNFQVNLNDLGDIDDFMHTYLGVDPGFSLEGMLSNVLNTEDLVKQIMGGDLTQVLAPIVDSALNAGPVNGVITSFADAINVVNHIPEEISNRTADVLDEFREELLNQITAGLEPLNGAGGQLQGLFDDLAGYLAAPMDTVNSYPGNPLTPAQQQEIQDRLQQLQDALDLIDGILGDLQGGIGTARNEINSLANDLDTALVQVTNLLNTIKTTITDPAGALGNFTGLANNPIIKKVDEIKGTVKDVLDAIQAVDIEKIGEELDAAASAVGADLDTSAVVDMGKSIKSLAASLQEIIHDAETLLQGQYGNMPTIFDQAEAFLDQILANLNLVNTQLDTVQAVLIGYLDDADSQVSLLKGHVDSLRELLSSDLPIPDAGIYPDYNSLVALGRQKLNELASTMVDALIAQAPPGILQTALTNIKAQITGDPNKAFQFAFVDAIETLLDAPLKQAQDLITNELQSILDQALSVIPTPDASDIKSIIRNAILNSQPVNELSEAFFDLLSPISDAVDEVANQLAANLNSLIQEAIQAIADGLNAAIESVTSQIADFDLVGGRLDGFAIVNQEELEQIHIEAEFTFGGDPDPTTYFAALDITSWNSENGKGACVSDGTGLIDAVISTRDISAEMLGLPIGIKEAALGFTLDGGIPIGVFGRVYTSGEINFEAAAIRDIGLEFGMGAIENYLGGKAAGRFQSYTINVIAFYFGKTCDFGVLERLDPEVAEFIGETVPLIGVYVRGAVSLPIINYGCPLTIGAGVDLGIWYLSGIFGGLFGGSVWGEALCLVSIKGKVTLMGLKSGSDYKFNGKGWIAGGLGFCEPEDWNSISDVRDDDWCLTGDASFGATYSSVNSDFSLQGPDFSCCD